MALTKQVQLLLTTIKKKTNTHVTSELIELVAQEVLCWPNNRKWKTKDKDVRFGSFFGANSIVITDLWNRINNRGLAEGCHPKHLLWGLLLLKVCGTEEMSCSIVGWPMTKTFLKWAWHIVKKTSSLKNELIQLDNRFDGLDGTVV